MQLTRERMLPVSPQAAWSALNDADVLRACIPGCDSVLAVSSSRFDVVVVASLGPVRAKLSGELHVLPHDDLHPPATYTLRFEGRGGITGRVRGEARVRLEPRGADQTTLRYSARATLDGGVVQFGAHFIDRAAQELADAFFAAFDAHVRRSGR
jgi:carbon monoxide dehydrogenase subunit G